MAEIAAALASVQTARTKPREISQSESERREERARRWDTEFIACINHPDGRCKRSAYVRGGTRKCSSCHHYYPNGVPRPATRRYWTSEQRRWRRLSRRTWHRIRENAI